MAVMVRALNLITTEERAARFRGGGGRSKPGRPGSNVSAQAPDPMMRARADRYFVGADHADRAVGLKHGEQHVGDVGPTMLAQRLPQLLAGDPGAEEVRLEQLPALDQHYPFPPNQLRAPPPLHPPPLH